MNHGTEEGNVVRFHASEMLHSISGYILTTVIRPHPVITLFM